jgi:hypothetical protein
VRPDTPYEQSEAIALAVQTRWEALPLAAAKLIALQFLCQTSVVTRQKDNRQWKTGRVGLTLYDFLK